VKKATAASLLRTCGLAALAVATYARTLRVPFVFDDLINLVENPLIRSLHPFLHPGTAGAMGASGPQLFGFQTRPVAFLSFALNYRFGGLDVVGYHFVNLAIHLLSALLLYRLVERTLSLPLFDRSAVRTREPWVAWFSAALFLTHPLQTQAVTYIVQRMASLAAMFCLLSLVAYLDARTGVSPLRRRLAYSLSLLSLVAAMLTKQNAFTFPLLIALYEILFLSGPLRRRLIRLIPHLMTLSIVPGLLAVAAAGGTGGLSSVVASARAGSALSRLEYLWNQFPVVIAYLRLIAWPAGQNVDWDPPVYSSPLEPPVLLSVLGLTLLAGCALWSLMHSRKSDPAWRLVGYGILWFLVALAVESSLIPIEDLLVEHRVYLPSAGIFMALPTLIVLLVPARRLVLAAVVGGTGIVALSTAAYLRNDVWRSEIRLWSDAVAKSPGRARTHFNLGDYLRRAGDLPGAREQWLATVAIDPSHTEALNALGNLAQMNGDLSGAVALYRRAVESQPANAEAQFNLAAVSDRLGDLSGAAGHYQTFLDLAGPLYPRQAQIARARLAQLRAGGFVAPSVVDGTPPGAARERGASERRW